MQKSFPKREAIYACLQETESHPSAEWIYQQLRSQNPDISMATVYRNLARFRDEGRICSVGTVKGVERFDGDTHPHPHFICEECGSILDMHQLNVDTQFLETAQQAVGGRVDGYNLCFRGLCDQCLNKNN